MIEFKISEVVGYSWEKMKKNVWFFVVLMIILSLIQCLIQIIPTDTKTVGANVFAAISFVAFIVQLIISIGTIKIALNAVDNKKLEYSTLFSEYALFFRFLGVNILIGIIVFFGLLLLIVPGIIWATKFQFAPYLIIDKKMKIMESLEESSVITKGNIGHLIVLGIVILGINILGLLALGVGLLLTIPTGMIASAYIYRLLSKSFNNKSGKQESATVATA